MAIPSIHPDRLIELFTRFVTIDGVSLAERNIADAATGVLVSAGIHVQEDSSGTNRGGNAGNLWCFPPGFDRNQPALMLTAHLDTVLPTANLKPIVGQGKITSDGTTILGADNRAGLSVLTNLLLTVSDGKIPTRNFFVVFTIAEEIGLLGADGLDLTGYDVRSAYVFDCSKRPGEYIKECVGLSHFHARIIGKAAHAGVAPEEGINAIALACAGIAKLEVGRIDPDLTVNIGTITGGKATNVVPDNVEIKGEVRSFYPARIEQRLHLIRTTLLESIHEVGKVEFENKMEFEPYVHSEDAAIVREVERVLDAVGLAPQPIRYSGGSDANVYNARGIPAVNLGIGAQKPHTFEEFVLIEDLVKSAEIALALVQL